MSSRMTDLLNIDSLESVGSEKKAVLGEEAKKVLYDTGYTKPSPKSPPKAKAVPKEIPREKKVSVKPVKSTRRSRTKYKGPILSVRTRPGFKELFDDVALQEDYYNVEFIEVLLANYLQSHGLTSELEKLEKMGVEIAE